MATLTLIKGKVVNQGELRDFKLQSFLDVINEFVRADEIIRALWLCDNMPGFYRDFVPLEIINLKNKILAKVATPTTYSTSQFDKNIAFEDRNQTSKTLRAQLILRETAIFNEGGIIPHIVDCGPGEYWLPFLLKREGINFTYEDVYLASEAHDLAAAHLKEEMVPRKDGSPVIFVACEIIEHLWREHDIKTEMLSRVGLADIIHISTPRYTYGQFCEDWDKEKEHLGHLRTYTPNEFVNLLHGLFPEYNYKFFDSFVLHMRLVKKGLHQSVVGMFDHIVLEELKK